jgi:hypothetical protein
MAPKASGFAITHVELARILEISVPKLNEIIEFFDADPSDEWELKDGYHFVTVNKTLDERLFSEQGAFAIAKYIDETQPQGIFAKIIEFVTHRKEKIRNAFINQKILENSSSLTVRNNRHFLSKKDIVAIFCTSYARINKAFDEIKVSDNPLIIYEDFDDYEGDRYYSLSGMDKLSRHFAKLLTVKDRRAWCEAVEIVGKKTFKIIIDAEAARQKRIESAMKRAKTRDKNHCQVTGAKNAIEKRVNLVAHHIYDKQKHPDLEDSLDNLITMSEEIHNSFHAWNGGYKETCNPDCLIQYVQTFYPDNYEIIDRLNKVKKKLLINPAT